MQTGATIKLKHCELEVTDWGCVTRFADGSHFGAHPHDMPHYHVISHRCGYGDDLMRYCVEHELAHSVVAEWFRDAPSAVIWALAHGEEPEPYATLAEEVLAQTLQRWARTNERPILGGVDWDALRRHFLTLMLEAQP